MLVVTTQDVRDWCRIDGDADDALLETLILAAQAQAEAYCNITLVSGNTHPAIRQAIAVMAADLYANREGQTVGTDTFYRLLGSFRQDIV